jgi:hypothetical protein
MSGRWHPNGRAPHGSAPQPQRSACVDGPFCCPLPAAPRRIASRPDIYYYYNRVWGHPDGTAAIAQSSDSVDECLILHNNVYSGYN